MLLYRYWCVGKDSNLRRRVYALFSSAELPAHKNNIFFGTFHGFLYFLCPKFQSVMTPTLLQRYCCISQGTASNQCVSLGASRCASLEGHLEFFKWFKYIVTLRSVNHTSYYSLICYWECRESDLNRYEQSSRAFKARASAYSATPA